MSDGGSIVGSAETVVVEQPPLPKPAAPASIVMPDHEVRNARWYQVYVRLARPTLDWITNVAVAVALIAMPLAGDTPAEGFIMLVLGWAGVVYGIKTYEKTKGVS